MSNNIKLKCDASQAASNNSDYKYIDIYNSHYGGSNSYGDFTQKGFAEFRAVIESERYHSLQQLRKKKLQTFQNDVARRVSFLQNLKDIEKCKQDLNLFEKNQCTQLNVNKSHLCGGLDTRKNFYNIAMKDMQTLPSESNKKLRKLGQKIEEERKDARRKLYSKKRKVFPDPLPGGLWDATVNKQDGSKTNFEISPTKQCLLDEWSDPDSWTGENRIIVPENNFETKLDHPNVVAAEKKVSKLDSSMNKTEIAYHRSSSSHDSQIDQEENQNDLMISDIHKKVALSLHDKGVEQKDMQKQQMYWKYRKIFMQMEREKVKRKQSSQRYSQKVKILKLNREKERELRERQYKMETDKIDQVLTIKDLNISQKDVSLRDEQPNPIYMENKELESYMEAVRKVARERITLSGITLPPLCQCGPSIWDSHPDTCANNCIFYKNPKVYVKFLIAALANTR